MHTTTLLYVAAAAATHIMNVAGSTPSREFAAPNGAVHHGTVSMWAGASDLAVRLPELRAHPTVTVDVLMLGTDLLVHSNGSLECKPNCTYWRDNMAQITAAGIEPWAWLTGGSVGGTAGFRSLLPNHTDAVVQALVWGCSALELKGYNLDWELGHAMSSDRAALALLFAKLHPALNAAGCKLSLHSGGGRGAINHVEPEYVDNLDEVTCGALYRGHSLDDWEHTLNETLSVVPESKLRPGFCCGGCKDAWSRSNASVTERFDLLASKHPNMTKVAVWRLNATCPTPYYWPELAKFSHGGAAFLHLPSSLVNRRESSVGVYRQDVGGRTHKTSVALPSFMRGAAMGMLPEFDCNGTCSKYRANATAPPQDALQILSDYGLNTVRLRLFGPDAFPNNSYAALPEVLAMARRAKAAGLQISLDIFYTQWYFGADSYYLERRTPPRWANLSFPALVEAAAQYTSDAVGALAAQGTPPTTVQIGNEIDCGLFHPWTNQPCSSGAEVCSCKNNWPNLARVISACATAARHAAPGVEVIIQLGASKQLGNDDEWNGLYNFYTQIGDDWDAFGLSFYQIWGAHNVNNLCTMRRLAKDLPNKRIYVIETGYPYKRGGHAPQDMLPRPQFPVSPEGQLSWLRAVLFTVEHGLWGRGAGVSWWGTEYAACSGDECAGFWDESFVALPVLATRGFRPTEVAPPPPGGVVCPPL